MPRQPDIPDHEPSGPMLSDAELRDRRIELEWIYDRAKKRMKAPDRREQIAGEGWRKAFGLPPDDDD